jgi:sulfide:quinone oxidoreductase
MVPLRSKPDPSGRRLVLIAGGGVAGLEALIGLRTLAGERVELELISPERVFGYRPLAVAAAFGGGSGPGIDIAELAESVGATYLTDAVASVDRAENMVTLQSGARRGYDVLVMGPGARAQEAIPGALTFGAPHGTQRFRKLLAEAEAGHIARLVFAVPEKSGWPLALYELAMLTAERLRAAGVSVEITLVTPELVPLAAFGGRASGAVLEDLEERGIHFVAGVYPEELAWGELRTRPSRIRIGADAVVTLPRLRGPRVLGLPSDEEGFIPVDAHGLVRGMTDVYAAGDATTFPIKHGGLAALQADAAAEAIAASVGAAVVPTPFRPILRGLLLTGREPRYLEAVLTGGSELAPAQPSATESGVASLRPLWWPPAKIAGRYLAPYLSGQVTSAPMPPDGLRVQLEIDDPASIATGGR